MKSGEAVPCAVPDKLMRPDTRRHRRMSAFEATWLLRSRLAENCSI